jgi:hypothetical protein
MECLLYSTASVSANGGIQVAYPPVKSPQHEQLRQTAMQGQMLETWVSKLNPHLTQPINLTVSLLECGYANAEYAPALRQIHMCYEMLDMVISLSSQYASASDAANYVRGAWTFIFYHEFGHAMTHLYDLPVVGKEEDAVDQFATLFVADGKEPNREQIALSGAYIFWWLLPATDQMGIWLGSPPLDQQHIYADSHGLGQQRFYNIICMLYGNDPERFQQYVAPFRIQHLHPEKAKYCPAEYRQIKHRWGALTENYFKW